MKSLKITRRNVKKVFSLLYVAVLLFTSMFLPTTTFSASFKKELDSTSAQELDSALATVNDLFDSVALYLVDNVDLDCTPYFSDAKSSSYDCKFFTDYFKFQKEIDKFDGEGNERYEINITPIDYTIRKNVISMTVSAKHSSKYIKLDVDSGFKESYDIVLMKENSLWKIKSVFLHDTYLYQELYPTSDIEIAAAIQRMNEQAALWAMKPVEQIKENYNQTAASRVYHFVDFNRVVSYARQYAEVHNLKFPYINTDCQNFVSQAIWYGAGGVDTSEMINNLSLPMVANRWHCKPGSYTSSWSSCSEFQLQVKNNYINGTSGPRGIQYNYIAAEPGDVIQLTWVDSNGNPIGNHAYVVTAVTGVSGYRTFSNITICAHDNDTLDKTLAWSIGNSLVTNVTTIHVISISA